MKRTVLGSLVFVAAVASGLAAQGPNAANTERTIMGCVAGDGSDASPWMLTGVIIYPPAPPAPAGGRGGGRGAGGGGGRGGGGAPGAAGAPAEGPAPAGGPPAAGGQGGGRGARGGAPAAPAAPAAPPPPPPPPQSFKLTGINMVPWNHMRAEVTGTGTNADFKVRDVRSMFGGGCQ
jgi:hypothetical protein